MSSDFNYNFDFVVEKFSSLGILENLDVSTLDVSYSDSGVNSHTFVMHQFS